ncbi:hypothetical protein B0O99DRAFT_724405 [Bisporella sp. PMI_857]|nr:hypothetical protein B0O99DRAFT_729075 [Bisporella sp. PMI_857]KAH8600532.1 hypothetical protein B0O99DRAFT_724405 [Bisporella sp. PMI_857]
MENYLHTTPEMLATPSQTPESMASGSASASVPVLAPPPASAPVQKITRGHSCILCQQRKVKCDRQKPCSNCIKARVECVPSAPAAPRRRRKKFSEQDLGSKLKKYEMLLKKHGIKIEEDDHEPLDDPTDSHFHEARGEFRRGLTMGLPPRDDDKGMLFRDKENSRYVEKYEHSILLSTKMLTGEVLYGKILEMRLKDPITKESLQIQASSDDEINESGLYPEPERFLVGHGVPPTDLYSCHPPVGQIFRLWQTFLVNVNPLVKIFHAPTVQQTLIDATSDLHYIPKHVEALMFAIYLLAVTSMQPEECETMLGDTKNNLLKKFSTSVQQALINARLLKSLNLTTLQAFVLYILAVRKCYDPHSMWILTGSAVRIAQRLGIHRDGADHQISPFDVEMRRRTCGRSSSLTDKPLNWQELGFLSGTFKVGKDLTMHPDLGPEHMSKKDKSIDELEVIFQEKFIRFCDPSIPAHLLAIYMSKSVLCTMRIMAHHPRQYPDKGASMPQKEKDMLFKLSLNELEISSMVHGDNSIRGFMWHIQVHFQLDAFIYLLSELRSRVSGEEVDRAWKHVEFAFENRPEFSETPRIAWTKREEAGGLYGGAQMTTPPRFISVLRSQRRIAETPPQTTEYRSQEPRPKPALIEAPPNEYLTATNAYPNNVHEMSQWNQSDFPIDMNMPDIAALDWEYYQTLLDGDLPAYYPGQDPVYTGPSFAA